MHPSHARGTCLRLSAFAGAVLALASCEATMAPPAAGNPVPPTPVPADPAPPNPAAREWLMVSDFDGRSEFPIFWMMYVGGKLTGISGHEPPTGTVVPPRGTGTTAMHLQGPAVTDGADINIHHHFDWTTLFSSARFWARAGGDSPVDLIFSITEILGDGRGYFSDARAGKPWPAQRVRLTPEWRQYTIEFSDLAAETPGTPLPLVGQFANGGAEVHFVTPEDGAYDIWIDDFELRCRPGRCAQ